jgi:hypothetical protein
MYWLWKHAQGTRHLHMMLQQACGVHPGCEWEKHQQQERKEV